MEHGKHHLASHINHRDLRSDNTLHVIGVLSNPARFHSRYRLAREWQEHMAATPNVKLHMVESAFGDRHHEVVDGLDSVLRLRTSSEIWTKENMINLGVKSLLPVDWKYVAWVDCDTHFRDSSWAQETLHQLQHWPIVQPWMQCADLGFRGDIRNMDHSFGYLWHNGKIPEHHSKNKTPYEKFKYGHTGYAWACTRGFWEQVGGLMDWCILGSADHHMAWACVNKVDDTINGNCTPAFFRKAHEWQARAVRACHQQVSFVNGRIEHNFHGPKGRRGYRDRWKLLIEHAYNPDTDLMYDAQGMIQLVGKPQLEQAIRMYNRSRGEDSIEDD
jgi:hypothetical protein